MAKLTEKKILEALGMVQEPELHKDLVSLNMIHNLKIDGDKVSFSIMLTTPACPLRSQIQKEAEQAVLDGEAHGWLASMPQPEFLALQHPDKVDIPLAKPILPYKAGFGIRKGEQEWLNFLNAWVTARQADMWLSSTHRHWFKSLNWRKETEQ